MRPVVLVGEDNPHGSDLRLALFDRPFGCAGDRLRRHVLQVPRDLYLRRFRRVNLCTGRWSMPAAREAARAILAEPVPEVGPDRLLVLLGRKVAGAFGLDGTPFDHPAFSGVFLRPGLRAVLLPHPSGRCREWNVPDAFERAREVLHEAAPDVPWGWAPEGGP